MRNQSRTIKLCAHLISNFIYFHENMLYMCFFFLSLVLIKRMYKKKIMFHVFFTHGFHIGGELGSLFGLLCASPKAYL